MGAIKQLYKLGLGSIAVNFPTFSDQFVRYDFTDQNTLVFNGSKIITINDKFGSGNNLTQAIDANRPTWYSSGGQNNLPYASFSPSVSLTKTLTLSQPYTIFMVLKPKNWLHQSLFIDFNDYLNSIASLIETYSTPLGTKSKDRISAVANAAWIGLNYSNFQNTYGIYGFGLNHPNKVIINFGGTYQEGLNSPGSASVSKIKIGGLYSLDLDIHEVIVWGKILSINEQYQLCSYFNYKYNIFDNIPIFANFGDSIANGTDATNSFGYARIVEYTKFANPGYFVDYSKTSTGIDYVISQYNTYMSYTNRKCYILFQTGTNDASIDSTWNNKYRGLISTAISDGFDRNRIIVITPPYSSTRIAKNTQIQSYLTQIQTDFGVKYADCVTYMQNNGGDSLLSDGTHPTSNGHIAMSVPILNAF